jgi:hypothetical protein
MKRRIVLVTPVVVVLVAGHVSAQGPPLFRPMVGQAIVE